MIGKIEHPSVKKMWNNYLKQIGENVSSTEKVYTSSHFDNNESSANELVELVLRGKKKATASSYWVYEAGIEPMPKEDDYSIVTDWNGIAKCIIRSTKVQVIPFNKMTEDLAKQEGEGDLSLDYWKRVHNSFFKDECKELGRDYKEDMPVVFEEFEVIYK